MDPNAFVSTGALIVLTAPTFLLAVIACVMGSCNRKELAQQRREIGALKNAMYIPQAQYYPPQPSAPGPVPVEWA